MNSHMSTSTESCHDLDMAEAENRQSVYSPASSYSTFSREVKYIFNPAQDNRDEYRDYSHIKNRHEQNYMSHTPHSAAASSQPPGKENRTPFSPRDEQLFSPHQFVPSQHAVPARTGSVLSSVSRDRGPISPQVEEAIYSSTHEYNSFKQNAFSDHGVKERIYFNPNRETTTYSSAKNPYPGWKNNNNVSHYQSTQKVCNVHTDMHNKLNRNGSFGSFGPNSFQNQQQPPLNNIHNVHHYQQPNNHHTVVTEPPHPQQPHGQTYGPPYPMPPRYGHQQHSRRKTWSPLALKMGLVNGGTQESRVCYSNDSLDMADESGIERRTQNMTEDLDATPPKLAPVSGVLAQKPGPNVIRPIAFKPIRASPARSPVCHVTLRQHGADDRATGSDGLARRPSSMKLGGSLLGIQGSPDSQNGRAVVGAFNSTGKLHNLSSGGGALLPASNHHSTEGVNHSHTPALHSHSTSADSSQHSSSNSSYHSASISSHHSASSNSYKNTHPGSSHGVGSSRLSTGEETSFSSEFPCPSERADSVPSLSISRVSSRAVEGVLQTPSPSDSGVGELEAMLREREAEINTLREVMDRNERAIFQVYEERRNMWLQETDELQNDYERRLKIQSRKSYKTEQVLSLQVYKLQQEQKTLQDENTKVSCERDLLRQQYDESQNLVIHLKQKLETLLASQADKDKQEDEVDEEDANTNKEGLSLQEELAMKNKELISLKSQFHALQSEIDKKNKELMEKVRDLCTKTEEVRSLKDELHSLKNPPTYEEASTQTCASSEVIAPDNMRPTVPGERDRTISGLHQEVAELRAEMAVVKQGHESEKGQWLDEKNKVIRYQKQLQLNYVQMQRKNMALEHEVHQLTLELESRDIKLIALCGEESVC